MQELVFTTPELSDPIILMALAVIVISSLIIISRLFQTPKMLHVPFSELSKSKLDKKNLGKLRKRYYLSESLSERLQGIHLRYPGEILKYTDVIINSDPQEVFKLLVPPLSSQPEFDLKFQVQDQTKLDLKIKSSNEVLRDTTIKSYLWSLEDNTYRINFSDANGEIFSVALSTSFDIDPTTLKIGGYWFWELPKLPNSILKKIFYKLATEEITQEIKKIGLMDESLQPIHDGIVVPIRKTAQIMTALFSAVGALRDSSVVDAPTYDTLGPYRPGQGMSDDDFPGGDCTLSPDWPFLECCVAHDYCYINHPYGCTNCDRFKCDLDFLNCMLGIAGVNPLLIEMAFIYFVAVRTFGGIPYDDYCGGVGVTGVTTGVVTGVVVGGAAVGGGLAALTLAGGVSVITTVVVGFAALSALVATLIIAGKIMCAVCTLVEEAVEKCEADRVVRERRCKKKKKKCRKKKCGRWNFKCKAKKLWCKIKYFFECIVWEYIVRGACWIAKVTYRLVCS